MKAVKDKDPQAGLDLKIETKNEKASEVHAYIGIQTEVYTFRNAYDDATYGGATDHFNTLMMMRPLTLAQPLQMLLSPEMALTPYR